MILEFAKDVLIVTVQLTILLPRYKVSLGGHKDDGIKWKLNTNRYGYKKRCDLNIYVNV